MRAFGVIPLASVSLALSLVACSEKPEASSKAAEPARLDHSRNEIFITRDNHITWNGQTISEAQLTELLRRTRQISPEPELSLRPDARSGYEVSTSVLRIIKESGTTKFGFVGNEQYVAPGAPAR